ncbi:hypothetical protein NF27_BR00030 [Candidatus Jidaibacter acanthamoeba]|uniref:Uncharacterized protein n=2 Tax=Candidatus Jidaibacter acanthamoebae TaxID=86105 RepID=A0A0C1R1A5_9RICK|nr:hypothetical protein NF27_BR00030 [Candidatus Jidaibacter acanthamoeba]
MQPPKQKANIHLIISLILMVLLSCSFITIYALKKFDLQQKELLASFYNSFLKEIIHDIDRAKLILSIAGENIKPVKDNTFKINKYINEFNIQTLFARVKNYRIYLENCKGSTHSIYKIHDIIDKIKVSHLLEQGRCLIIEFDYNELLNNTSYFADSNHISYVLINSEKNNFINNITKDKNDYKSHIKLEKNLKNGIIILAWINKDYLYEKYKEIIILAISVMLIMLICIIYLFLKSKNYFSNILHNHYESQILNINSTCKKLISTNSELEVTYKQLKGTLSVRNEIHSTIVQGLQKSSSDIANSLASLLEKFRIVKGTELHYMHLEHEIQSIFFKTLNLSEQKILIKDSDSIDLKSIIEKSIAYWLDEIQEKKLSIIFNYKLSKLNLPYSSITITQILCSLIGLIISTLPKEKQLIINITSSSTDIELELIDNGFHFNLEELDKHTRNNKMFNFLLLWEELIIALKELNIRYQSCTNTETNNIFRILLSKSTIAEQEVRKQNVVALSDYKKS